ncbi:MAG: hypothetical protein ACYDBJ_24745 [Aggregatilineales bacterium]
MSQHKRFDARLNVYVSAELQRKLEQIRDQRGPQATVPDVVRDAIRQYIDNEEEIIGSRRHFQRSLRDTVEAAKLELTWNSLILFAFIWQGTSPVVEATTHKQMPFKETLDRAVAFAGRNWLVLTEALGDGIEVAHKALQDELKKGTK